MKVVLKDLCKLNKIASVSYYNQNKLIHYSLFNINIFYNKTAIKNNITTSNTIKYNNITKKQFSIFIKTQSTPNPHFLKFQPGKNVLSGDNTYDIENKTKALKSPLASKLFEIPGVSRVTYGPDFISVGKEELTDWSDIKPLIIDEIVNSFTNNEDLFYNPNDNIENEPEDTKILDSDSEAVKLIKEIISTRIRPNLQDDGGDVKYVRFDEEQGIVYLKMKGTCSNCQHSEATFKNGIEKMLIHFVSEVEGVEETDSEE